MKTFVVLVKWPSGKQHKVGITPGAPLVFPNQEKPPKSDQPRAIATLDDACEYAMGTFHNRISPVAVEWPCEVTPIEERAQTQADADAARAVVKALQGKPSNE